MGFIMDGLNAESYDRSYSNRQLIGRLGRYFRPFLPVMGLVSAMIVLNSLMDAALPILIARGVDRLATEGSDQVAWLLGSAILVAGVLSWLFNYARQAQTARVVGDVVLAVRLDAFKAVMERDLSFYDEHPSGKIVSRVTSDTDEFANVLTLTLNLVSQVLLLGIVTVALFARSVSLALLALAIAPVIVALALGFRKIARESSRGAQRSLSQVNSTIQEGMSGIAVAKNFRQEGRLYEEFGGINARSYAITLRQGFVFSAIFPLLFTVAGLGTTLVVYAGGRQAIAGDVSTGDWYLFVQSIVLFWFPLTSIASFWSQFQQGLAASERVFALIDATPRVVQRDHQPVGHLAGRIEFRNVDFGYTDDPAHRVLTAFNLTIAAGETVALVGHTGAGKSTLGKLVARFYEFQGGQILIDDLDIRSFDLLDYRRRLGVVPQTPFLFNGTIADNIRYARPEASDADVANAARAIGGGDWLDVLPQGLDTEVGEQGKGLSMGQRQLVALARVLIQDPAVIVLDEATASVDPLTETQIQEGLDVVLEHRTAIVIAHRLSTIQHADRIIVLRRGQIVEEGSHVALMARGGHYADLYNTYFRHQSPDYLPGTGFIPVLTGVTDDAR